MFSVHLFVKDEFKRLVWGFDYFGDLNLLFHTTIYIKRISAEFLLFLFFFSHTSSNLFFLSPIL